MNNHFRADGSTWHVLNYNQQTGAVTARYTSQGYADSSCWSRGQAWAIYGFVSAYRWTKNVAFLNTAVKAADYFLARLPADGVPYWYSSHQCTSGFLSIRVLTGYVGISMHR